MYTKRRLFVVNEKDAHTHICTYNVRVMYDLVAHYMRTLDVLYHAF